MWLELVALESSLLFFLASIAALSTLIVFLRLRFRVFLFPLEERLVFLRLRIERRVFRLFPPEITQPVVAQ